MICLYPDPHRIALVEHHPQDCLCQPRKARPAAQVHTSAGGSVHHVNKPPKVAGLPAKAGPHLGCVCGAPVDADKHPCRVPAPRRAQVVGFGSCAEAQSVVLAVLQQL